MNTTLENKPGEKTINEVKSVVNRSLQHNSTPCNDQANYIGFSLAVGGILFGVMASLITWVGLAHWLQGGTEWEIGTGVLILALTLPVCIYALLHDQEWAVINPNRQWQSILSIPTIAAFATFMMPFITIAGLSCWFMWSNFHRIRIYGPRIVKRLLQDGENHHFWEISNPGYSVVSTPSGEQDIR